MTTLVFNKGSGYARPNTEAQYAEQLRRIEAEIKAACAPRPVVVQAAPKPSLTAEVARVLKQKGNEGVIAYVNEKTGETRSYLVPKPPAVPERATSGLERMGLQK